jgi:hypothetical protein
MPNWVTNVLRIDCDDKTLKDIKKFISSKESAIDFNKIIPQPESLNVTSSSDAEDALHFLYYKPNTGKSEADPYGEEDWDDTEKYKSPYFSLLDRISANSRLQKAKSSFTEEAIELAKKYKYNLDTYGFRTWYDWRCNNWGTKWNASEANDLDDGVSFETAWSSPYPVMRTISEMFPDATLTVDFADEDIGHNCGTYVLKAGEQIDFTDGDREFALKLKGWEDWTEDDSL